VTITEYLGTLSKPVLIALGMLWLISVSVADYFTHSTYLLEFSPFYLVPVSFFSWFIGKRSGIAVAISSVAIGFMVRFRDAHRAVGYWDALILSALYITATFMIVQLKRLYEREKDLSRIDPLTRIPNRRAFYEAASQAKSVAERTQLPLSISYIDVDNFKSINDRFGHNMGDQVLMLAAATIAGALRPSDVVARMGGDEFAVLLPGANGNDAAGIMRRVEDQLQHTLRQHRWPVKFSIGIASFYPPLASISEMLAHADEAMYAKKRGHEPLDQCGVVT
jgi:diguanylate cyclase (GGDEF)-like protein